MYEINILQSYGGFTAIKVKGGQLITVNLPSELLPSTYLIKGHQLETYSLCT